MTQPPPARHLLDQPHHDGSSVYVKPGPYTLDDVVPVRLRVPTSPGVRDVWLRTVRDGEPRMERTRLDRSNGHEDIYVADVLVHNTSTPYRFLLDRPDAPGGYSWLNGSGVWQRDIADAHDFRLLTAPPPPAWLNAGTVYQVFPDRFARSTSADTRPLPSWAVPAEWGSTPAPLPPLTGRQIYGGDLAGIIDHLDHLEALGINTLYMTPFFPGRSNHRYDASTFECVDPLLGGDSALAALSAAVHARGMRLIGDITTNHTGAHHDWFQRALENPSSPEHGMYMWAGQGRIPATGRDIDSRRQPAYVSWLGVASLPKLDWESDEVWQRMVDRDDSAIARWMRPPYNLDGWRVDVANMTGRYGADNHTVPISQRIRKRMTGINPQAALVGEHFFDYTHDLPGDGWQAAMNYAGFSRPVWGWLADPHSGLDFISVPLPRRRIPGRNIADTMRDFAARVPWQVASVQLNNLGSHDTPRLLNSVGTRENVELAAALLFTYPGVPMLFAGDEIGARGTNGEHARVTMPWDLAGLDGAGAAGSGSGTGTTGDSTGAGGGSRWDGQTLQVFRTLSRLRGSRQALRDGGIRWAVIDDDALVYLRQSRDETLLVVVARDSWGGVTLPSWVIPNGDATGPELLYGGSLIATPELSVTPGGIHISGDGPAVGIWRIA